MSAREEPCVYVNGIACGLRRKGRSNVNVADYVGLAGARLDAVDERLARDVVAYAGAYTLLMPASQVRRRKCLGLVFADDRQLVCRA